MAVPFVDFLFTSEEEEKLPSLMKALAADETPFNPKDPKPLALDIYKDRFDFSHSMIQVSLLYFSSFYYFISITWQAQSKLCLD